MPLKSECPNQQKIILPRQFTQNISYHIKKIGNLQTQESHTPSQTAHASIAQNTTFVNMY